MSAPPPATPYRFSSEETRVLQECNRESFYQRCLPLSTLFGMSAYMGVRAGYFKPNPRFGATPNIIGAVIAGYLMGKVSYQGMCAEKLMPLPDSRIGAILRSRRYGGSEQNALVLEDWDLEKVMTDIPEAERFSDISNKSGMDLDLDRPLSPGPDDFRPILDELRHVTTYLQSEIICFPWIGYCDLPFIPLKITISKMKFDNRILLS